METVTGNAWPSRLIIGSGRSASSSLGRWRGKKTERIAGDAVPLTRSTVLERCRPTRPARRAAASVQPNCAWYKRDQHGSMNVSVSWRDSELPDPSAELPSVTVLSALVIEVKARTEVMVHSVALLTFAAP